MTRRRVRIAIVSVAVLLALAVSLWIGDSGPRRQVLEAGSVIKRTGIYERPDLGLTLEVQTPSRLVRFTLRDASGLVLLETPVRASDHSRWVFCISEDRSLWFHSGDIGTFQWVPSENGYVGVPLPRDRLGLLGIPPKFEVERNPR